MQNLNKPTKAFRIASLAALIVGVGAYFIGLYNAPMALNEKGSVSYTHLTLPTSDLV